jgi:hypothetical protein
MCHKIYLINVSSEWVEKKVQNPYYDRRVCKKMYFEKFHHLLRGLWK